MSDLKRSWVDSANTADSDFPLNNLPYGVFTAQGREPACGVALGDVIIDAAALEAAGHVSFGGVLGRRNMERVHGSGAGRMGRFEEQPDRAVLGRKRRSGRPSGASAAHERRRASHAL